MEVDPMEVEDGKSSQVDQTSHEGPSLRFRIFELLDNPASSNGARIWAFFIFLVTILSIVLFAISSLPEYRDKGMTLTIFVLELLVTIVFTLDYLLRLFTADEWYRWMFAYRNIIDLFAVLPFYIEVIVEDSSSNTNGFFVVRALRLIRLLRILRVLKLKKYAKDVRSTFKRLLPCIPNSVFPITRYFWHHFYKQCKAVVPIVIYIILFQYILLGPLVHNIGTIIGAHIGVIVGLYLFVEGLKMGMIPLADVIGHNLPDRVGFGWVLFVGFWAGTLVTIAEPAIGALSELNEVVDRSQNPYLSYLLDEWNYALVAFVGVGVGIATVIGLLKFRYGWRMKTVVYISMVPVITLTCVLMWGVTDLREIVGLSWDTGAVTTGEVTAPILLSLGLGVSKMNKNADEQSILLSGFGIVTLGSLYPILSTQILGLILMGAMSKEDIIAKGGHHEPGTWETTPAAEFILDIREVIPLVIFLLFMVKVVLKLPLPAPNLLDIIAKEEKPKPGTQEQEQEQDQELEPTQSQTPEVETSQNETYTSESSVIIYVGLALCFVGMLLFNFGLNFGLVTLGEQIGETLPSAFTKTEAVEGSPLFSRGFGTFIVLAFAWVLGYLTTMAEPALAIIGWKVQKAGEMTKKMFKVAVSCGVGFGLMLGVIKIIYDIHITYLILSCYGLCIILTYFSSELLVNFAWDGAGVTTGVVSAPFILALGTTWGQLLKIDGFGILSLASVFPILTVLITGFSVHVYQKYESWKHGDDEFVFSE